MSLYGDSPSTSSALESPKDTPLRVLANGTNYEEYRRFGFRYLAITQLLSVLIFIVWVFQNQAFFQEPVKAGFSVFAKVVSLLFAWLLFSLSKRENPGLHRLVLTFVCLSLIQLITVIYFAEFHRPKNSDDKTLAAYNQMLLALHWFGIFFTNGGSFFSWILSAAYRIPSLARAIPSWLNWTIFGLDHILIVAFWAWSAKPSGPGALSTSAGTEIRS